MPGVCAGFFYLCAVWQVRIPTASEQIDEEHLLCFAQTMQYAAEHSAYVHQWAQKTQSSKEISTKLR